MPTVLRIGPYRFHFYSREGMEPAHIHVARDDLEAKFWLAPIALARNFGFPLHEIRTIQGMIEENQQTLLSAWESFHG